MAAARAAAAVDAATAAAADRDGGHGATDHLGRLLSSVPAIEQTKGLLIGYYGIDHAAAFELLRRWSQQTNLKLNRLAELLLTAAAQPNPRPFGGLLITLVKLNLTNPPRGEYLAEHGTADAPGAPPPT